MLATLDALATALYVQIDDFLPARTGPGHPPKLTDSELITLAVCQMLLGLASSSRWRATGLGTCSPTCRSSPAITSACGGWRRQPRRARSRPPDARGSDLDGYTVLADKGLAGEEFESFMASLGADFRRPDRKDEPPRFRSLGALRRWIESVFWTCKGQLALERHGGRTVTGVAARVALRLLALATGLWHNWQIGQPGRELAPYGR